MQEVDRTVTRARRNTIGDAARCSAARNPEKDALVFGERRWSYAEVDAGANRVANALLEQGLEKGDRVAAYGMNSDAYVLLWLGCVRAGLIHVPVNFHLAGEELLYILNQSGSKALFYDPGFEENVEEVQDEIEARIYGTLYGGDESNVVSMARSGDDASAPDVELDEENVTQILYTSGTTSAPKGETLTHRALLAEYVSCIEALEYHPDDRALHSLPLYHSAQMHAFLMPDLLVGATNLVLVSPDPERCCELSERGEIVHRSPHLMTGYWEKPEETEEAFEGGWFHSEDLGYLDEEGYLYVVDRVKDVINTGGMQVSGREVEDALYDHEAVSEVAVVALPDEKWIEAVSAVVALRSGTEPDEALAEELRARARER